MNETKTISIPAAVNGVSGIFVDPTAGSVFVCTSATAAFKIKPDNRSKISMNAGRTYGNPGGRQFNQITFYNDTANIVTVTYYVGFDDFRPDPSAVAANVTTTAKDPSTYTKADNSNNINAGATKTYTGSDGTAQRKQIAISNGDAALVLQVLDNNNNIGGFIQPGQTWTMITNGVIKLKNPNGGGVSYAVMETFYS